MKRFRGPTVALLALAALAVVPAGASGSTGISAGDYPATLTGQSTTELSMMGTGVTAGCSSVSFTSALEEESATATTNSVTASGCSVGGLNMHGCQLVFDPSGAGSVAIGPPGCGPVSFSLSGACKIPAQEGISATYQNHGSGSGAYFTVAVDDENVEYTSTGSGCGSEKGTFNDLHVTGEFEVTAETGGTSVTTGGLYVGGDPEAGQFEAAEYPVDVTGERLDSEGIAGPAVVLDTGARQASCETAEYDGGTLASAASSLTLDAVYSECKYGAAAATISMNSCQYVFSDLTENTAGDYEGSAEIACNENDAVDITFGGNCNLAIPPQTLAEGETLFGNYDVANEAVLLGLVTASGIEYTSSGTLACKLMGLPKGTYENGSSESAMLLRGGF